MRKRLSLALALLLIPTIAYSNLILLGFVGNPLGVFPSSFGSTFVKQYDINQDSLDADESSGSPTATFTASRGSSNPATTIDADGLVSVTTTDDVARFVGGFYDSSGFTAAPGLLLEGASTNLIIHGIFDAGSGTATGWTYVDDVTNSPTLTLISEDLTNISGSQAQRIQHTLADGSFIEYQSDNTAVGSFAQNDYATVSVWVKGTVANVTIFKLFIREKDSSGVNGTSHSGSDIQSTLSSTEWKRFTFTAQLTDGDLSLAHFSLASNFSGSSGTIDVQVSGAQVENTRFPSSLIPTTTSALTRNIEVLTYVTADNFVGGTDGSMAHAYRPITLPDEQSGGSERHGPVVKIDNNNVWAIAYRTNANDKATFQTLAASTQLRADGSAEPFNSVRYSLHSLIGTYSTTQVAGDDLVLYLDGVDDGSNANYTVPTGSLPASFTIQLTDNLSQILTAIALFNKRLSASESNSVHTILTR